MRRGHLLVFTAVTAISALPLSAAPAAPPRSQSAAERGSDAASPDAAHPDSARPGEALRVYLLTMGRGELVWEKFGHNAIRIVDPERGTDIAWNWGIFDFSQENFWPRLVAGEMLYSMGAYDTDRTLYEYDYFDRAVWQQELDMTAAQKLALQQAIHEHWLPENRDYRYDYYRDNCSTRVRDLLDAALGGAISGTLAGDTTATSYRWHTRRALKDAPAAYAGIQLVLGHRAERPITAWEEGFLPLRLQAYLREVEVVGEDGTLRPLVREETLLVPSEREGAPAAAPNRLGWAAGLGLLIGAALLGLGRWAGRGSTAARVAFTSVAGLWSAAAGVAGTVLLGAWIFTEHWFWAVNENVLQVTPLHLAVAAALVPLLWRRAPGRVGRSLAVTVAALSAFGFVIQILPGLDQVNGEILALTVPPNVALGVALVRLSRAAGAAGDDPGPGPGSAAAARAA